LNEEGILRLSGSLAEINQLKEAVQHGQDVDFFEHDVHAVAGLLKVSHLNTLLNVVVYIFLVVFHKGITRRSHS
jgi:hypothetical protein